MRLFCISIFYIRACVIYLSYKLQNRWKYDGLFIRNVIKHYGDIGTLSSSLLYFVCMLHSSTSLRVQMGCWLWRTSATDSDDLFFLELYIIRFPCTLTRGTSIIVIITAIKIYNYRQDFSHKLIETFPLFVSQGLPIHRHLQYRWIYPKEICTSQKFPYRVVVTCNLTVWTYGGRM